jgi:hypothetical protein
MGHYASEMMCHTCGQCRCTCPPPPDRTLSQWVVDHDYSVLPVPEFDKKYDHYLVGGMRMPDSGRGRTFRLGREHFDTPDLAQQHALDLLAKAIATSEAKTASLRSRLQFLSTTRDKG